MPSSPWCERARARAHRPGSASVRASRLDRRESTFIDDPSWTSQVMGLEAVLGSVPARYGEPA